MAENYTAWFWRARSTFGKKGMYTTRHRMDEADAAEYFAKEGVAEFAKVESSAKIMQRLSPEEAFLVRVGTPRPADEE